VLVTLQRSSILMKRNRGFFNGAADAFMLYNNDGGRILKGLVTRRKDERALYLPFLNFCLYIVCGLK
jgi:lysozyme